MKNILKILPALVLFTFLLSSKNSCAQLSVGVNGSVASRWSTPKRIEALGLGYQVTAKYRFWKGLTAGINYSRYHFGPEAPLSSNVDYKITYTSYNGLIEYHFIKKRFKPYAGLDFGIYNYYTVTTIDFDNLGIQKQTLDKNYFGFAPHVGLNYAITKNILINSELKFNIIPIETGSPIGYYTFSLGLFYEFNRK